MIARQRTRSPEDARALLASRRARLGRLLALDAPDIILDAEMGLVSKSMAEVNGRRWNRIPVHRRVRNWLWQKAFDLRQPLLRCECGGRIWPWQKRVYDPDIGKTIHRTCGSPA